MNFCILLCGLFCFGRPKDSIRKHTVAGAVAVGCFNTGTQSLTRFKDAWDIESNEVLSAHLEDVDAKGIKQALACSREEMIIVKQRDKQRGETWGNNRQIFQGRAQHGFTARGMNLSPRKKTSSWSTMSLTIQFSNLVTKASDRSIGMPMGIGPEPQMANLYCIIVKMNPWKCLPKKFTVQP